jgi:hypothetical protein
MNTNQDNDDGQFDMEFK